MPGATLRAVCVYRLTECSQQPSATALLLSLFYEEKAEVQRSQATCQRSHSLRWGEGEFESRQFDSGVCVLNTASGGRRPGVVDKGLAPLGHPPTHTHTHTHGIVKPTRTHILSGWHVHVTPSLPYLPAVVYSSII